MGDEISPESYKAFYKDLEGVNDVAAYVSNEAAKYDILLYFSFGSSETELTDKYGDKVSEYIEQYNKGELVPQYTKHIYTEWRLFNEALEHLNTIIDYKKYLEDIEVRAQQMLKSPLLGKKDTFAYRNIKKTPLAYSHFQDNKPEFGNSKGVIGLTENRAADYIAIILIFYICFVLFLYENENGIFRIVRPALRGGCHTAFAKIGALFITCALIYILLYGSLYFTISNLYGMGDLTRKIQSVKSFLASTLDVTITEYLIIYSLSKIAVYFLLGLLVLSLCILLKNSVLVYVAACMLGGLNLALYSGIREQSAFGIFKYMSIIQLFQTN